MTDSTSRYAHEIHKRRALAGDSSSYNKTYAEVKFIEDIEAPITIDVLQPYGRSVHLVTSCVLGDLLIVCGESPWAVDQYIQCDACVFLRLDGKSYDRLGWLPWSEVVEAPQESHFYKVDLDHLIDAKDFVNPCVECGTLGLWSYETESWWCSDCGRYRYNKHDRESISEWSDPVSEKEETP